MKLRKALAGIVLASTLVTGGAAALSAPAGAAPAPSKACRVAVHTLNDLRRLDRRLRHDYANIVRLRNAAERRGNTELVAKLDAQLAKMRKVHAALVERAKKVAAVVKEKCGPEAEG